MSKNRYNTFPSRVQLQVFKVRTKAARQGHSLLKRKADALKSRINRIIREIYELKLEMNETMKSAQFSHSQARHAAGEFNSKVIANVETANTRIGCSLENVVGVKVLQFEKVTDNTNTEILIGLTKGGTQIRKCRDAFTKALDMIIKLGSLQTSFRQLDEAQKVTNRRVQALDNVVIPKLENTMHYISQALDEREREDLFRLKKVVQAKKAENKRRDEERRRREEEMERKGLTQSGMMEEPKSIFDTGMDENELDEEDDVADLI